MSKKAIFISVRSGSTRLPQKALKTICGRATIEHLIDRLKKSQCADIVVLCTTELSEDDRLCEIAQNNNIHYFRGSAPDKLQRWLGAAQKHDIDFFVNADGDDIFFDAGLADLCFTQYSQSGATLDFIDGRGLYNDVYGIKRSALEAVCRTKQDNDTEFVQPYFVDNKHGNNFLSAKIDQVPDKYQKRDFRLTLDYEEDLEFFRLVIEHFMHSKEEMTFENILLFLEDNPTIVAVNWHRETAWKANQERMIDEMEARLI